ncbi:MAG TPA: nuclear transport factor 2 family protein [Acidimicrobiia bacterium]|nr:nuclear transport factor 2 family protein [Acidimicrobiia bacterium]
MTSTGAASDDVLAANAAFYAALEACDLDAMAAVWEQSERVVVTHPGWPMLRGWRRVAESWAAIFRNTNFIRFVITDERCDVVGDTAWITAEENILQATGATGENVAESADLSGSRAVVTNVFVHDGTRWRLVVHHASPV